MLAAPIPLNPYWYQTIVRHGRKFNWEAVFVRETPLSLPTLLAARRLGIPAFLDMRENLAAMYEKHEHGRGIISQAVRHRWLIRNYESLVIDRFDHVFAVTVELKEWLLETYFIEEKDISVIGNYPKSRYLEQAERARTSKNRGGEKRSKVDSKIELVHAGYVSKDRGVQDVIRSLNVLKKSGYKSVHLRVVGKGKPPKYIKRLKKISKRIGVKNRVTFHEYPSPGGLADTLVNCDIGVSSNRLSELVHQTTPGKLWEYMAVGLPILSSARRPVMRIIEKENCGRVYKSREPREIAKQIELFIESPEGMRRMGKRAAKAVEKRYNERVNVRTLNTVFGNG
jgi:glycosyltransferase involved in cell wall biosynthesis